MRYPTIIRYIANTKGIGRSTFILIPLMIKNLMELENDEQVLMEYNLITKRLSLKKIPK